MNNLNKNKKISQFTANVDSIVSEPKYLRAKELAEYLRIGESTVWLYLKQKRIRSIKPSPRVTLFVVSEVEEAILN